MESTFDVFLTGEILPGYERGEAVSQLASVFKLDLGVADQLVNGQKRRVKAGCNKAAALQFRQILSAAGLQVALQRAGAQPDPSPPVSEEPAPFPYLESTDKAVFESQPLSNESVIQESITVDASAPLDYQPVEPTGAIATAKPKKVEIVGELEMAEVGELMVEPRPEVPPPVTALNFDLAPVGAPIPNLKRDLELVNPNVDHLKLVEGDGD